MKNEKVTFLITIVFIALLMSVRTVLQPGMSTGNRHTCLMMIWFITVTISTVAVSLEALMEKRRALALIPKN